MALICDYPESAARPAPVLTGNYLARNKRSLVERAFDGADLRAGRKTLIAPTLAQAAALARCSVTSVWWAERRQNQRWLIESGYVPLQPPPAARRANAAPIVPALTSDTINNDPGLTLADLCGLGDADLKVIASIVGVDRMMAAAESV